MKRTHTAAFSLCLLLFVMVGCSEDNPVSEIFDGNSDNGGSDNQGSRYIGNEYNIVRETRVLRDIPLQGGGVIPAGEFERVDTRLTVDDWHGYDLALDFNYLNISWITLPSNESGGRWTADYSIGSYRWRASGNISSSSISGTATEYQLMNDGRELATLEVTFSGDVI